ncbi:MAG: sulfite exporter TauE/SafE family protein [Dehalococcoidia bacterium]|nr:sulfite exporter TauE/SafE family protein [Dehalococcoidia bacterium]
MIGLGLAVGTFGTIVGAGGGFVLVPVLLLIYPERDPKVITAMSLFVVTLNAISGSFAYARQRRIDYWSGLWFGLATLPGAVAGALVVAYIPRRTFDAIFGVTLVSIGLYLALRSGVQAIQRPVTGWGVVSRSIGDISGPRFVYSYQLWKGLAISLGVGFLSSLLGIGGGVIHVPVMVTVLHFPVHIATATSQFVLSFMSAQGTAVHFWTGTLGWDEPLEQAVLLAVGAVPGAQLGAFLARRLPAITIMRVLAGALILVGVRLGLKAAGV